MTAGEWEAFGDASAAHQTVTIDGVTYSAQDGPCEWFARCTRTAAGFVAHPIIGPVPTCAECAAKLDLTFMAATAAPQQGDTNQ